MSADAAEAMRWTKRQLGDDHRAFLASLPLSVKIDDVLFVHASAASPGNWPYLDDAGTAVACLAATEARHVLCGHTHVPAHFHALPGRKPRHFRPRDNKPMPLPASQRFVTVCGAVGQPRDGNPAACYALLDTAAREVTMRRVPYDCDETLRKIKAAGLPDWLGVRLGFGR